MAFNSVAISFTSAAVNLAKGSRGGPHFIGVNMDIASFIVDTHVPIGNH